MSLHASEILACPKCGHKQATLIWQSLNVTLDPGQKQNLFDGKINVLECTQCGNKAFVDAPFHYHDMNLEFYVRYVPLASLEHPETFDDFLANGFPSMEENEDMGIPADSYLRTIHIVFDMGELVRYVMFRECLANIKQGKKA